MEWFSCEWTPLPHMTKRKCKCLPMGPVCAWRGRKNKPLLGFLGQFKASFQVRLKTLSKKSNVADVRLSRGNRVRGHLTVGGVTQNMFCAAIQVTIHYWLGSLCKWSRSVFSFLFPAGAAPRPGGMPSICDGSQGSHCGAKRTRGERTMAVTVGSDRRSQSVLLRADD